MKLVLLRCPICSSPLKPDQNDVVIACANCHTPLAITENGPMVTDVRFVDSETGPVEETKWMPFWVFEGRVNIIRRETQGGRSQNDESQALWGIPRKMYVPAWDAHPRTAQDIGSQLLQRQPSYKFRERPDKVRLEPATIYPEDARSLLEFIVLAIEARRKDWLQDLEFHLELDEPEMWALQESSFHR